MFYRAATGLAGVALRVAAPLAGPDWRERMVLDTPPEPLDGGVWLHAASVGELNSARPIAEALARDLPVLVTANTVTGRAAARGWGLPARLAPLDLPGAVARFLDAARPGLLLTVENEIWPNRAAAARARGIPQAVIGARMSAGSARGWSRARGLIGPVLEGIDLLSAQDAGTEERMLALGLPPRALAPRLTLKLLGPAAIRPPAAEDPGRAACWLAASTHEGEEEAILAAHAALCRSRPGLRLILAPRHPRRAAEVAGLAAQQGLGCAPLAGRDLAQVETDAPVVLVDRLGAMEQCYAAAGICLTGGSLTDRGGHTPWEPAAHACALLHGPHVSNFTAAYAALDGAGASRQIDAGSLADMVAALLDAPDRMRAMGRAARAALDAAAPDPAPLVRALRALVGR